MSVNEKLHDHESLIDNGWKASIGAIQKLISRAQALGLEWPLPAELDDARLASLLYPSADTSTGGRLNEPHWPEVHLQLQHKGVTKRLLWEEYTQNCPNRSYSYSQFCERYKRWLKRQRRSMHQLRIPLKATSDSGHMPERHRQHQRWTPGRLKHWARQIGPDTVQWISARLDEKDHPEQAYRLCLGLLNLSRQYPAQRLNATCRLANREGLTRLKQIRAVLKSNRDQLQCDLPLACTLPQDHENVRGPQDFH